MRRPLHVLIGDGSSLTVISNPQRDSGDKCQSAIFVLRIKPAVLPSHTCQHLVSEGGLQPSSLGFSPVHLIVYKVEPPVCAVPTT